MSLPHAALLALAACVIAAVTLRGRVHPLLAVTLAAAGFALASGMSVSQLGKNFGTGFGQAANTRGLPVLAAAMVSCIGARWGAAARLACFTATWGAWTRAVVLVALGLGAGTGTSPAAAFAVLAPLREPIGGAGAADQRRSALTLGLALSAAQAFLLPSPVLVAATAILAAQWTRVLAFGLPLALISALVGAVFAVRMAGREGGTVARSTAGAGSRTGATGLVAACLAMAFMLCVQSLGDIPSEPLGGGGAREFILGIGRPMIVLLVGVGVMVLATQAWRGGDLSEGGWVAAGVARGAPLILLLGAVGGFQNLTQTTEMAPLLAERLLPLPCGVALPFLVAMVMKILQGSSLVAAITAAGMMQPLLPALGLDGEIGRALCVLAVGAGAMSGAHVNDGFFWLVADGAGWRPARALACVTSGTVLQGIVAILVLVVVRAVF